MILSGIMICRKKALSLSDLILMLLAQRRWRCALCGTRFFRKEDLRRHLTRRQHGLSAAVAEEMLATARIDDDELPVPETDVTEVPKKKGRKKKVNDGRRIHFGAGPVKDDDGNVTMMAAKEYDGNGRLFRVPKARNGV